MKNLLTAILLAATGTINAQTETIQYRPGITPEGAVYFLPKTAIRIAVQVEKTTYTPGDFCQYAQKYLRISDVQQKPSESYKVTKIDVITEGFADKTKGFAVKFDAKTSATNVVLSDEGVLLAINADAQEVDKPKEFTPAPKLKQKSPRDFMSSEVLSASSTAKMAELTALDIYEIRESRNLLTRGQADFMPKDGAQLRLMLENLETQDKALTQLFTGIITKDTTEHIFTIIPEKDFSKQILFRLSKKLGIVDSDDLAGAPYYIDIKDLNILPAKEPVPANKKVEKNGVFVNVPGKIRMSIYKGNELTYTCETMVAQYGHTEFLSGDLFNKRYTTHLTLNPVTGAIMKLDAEMPK